MVLAVGVGEVEQVLRRAGKGYVLGVASTHQVRSWGKAPPVGGTAEAVAASRSPQDWQRLSAGAGTKGPRLHDWYYNLSAKEYGGKPDAIWTAACSFAATWETARWPFSRPGARPARRWRRWLP